MNLSQHEVIGQSLKTWVGSILAALLIATSIKSAIADWNVVPTGSMKPTIIEGDRIFINKLAYDFKIPYTTRHIAVWDHPEQGDIVVFFSPTDETRLVKRVVGVPGDIIAMQDNVLFINGKPAAYHHADDQIDQFIFTETLGRKIHPIMITPTRRSLRSFGPVRVPDEQYFMLGDNRDESADSRYFGFVERRRIIGQATIIVMSLDKEKFYCPRWDRFFADLP